jgi:hypothetical protein
MEGMASQVSLDTQNNVTEELISERRLWTAVLVNAVEDWRGGTLRARREAKSFFLNLTWTPRSFAPAQDWTPEIFAHDD